MNFDCWMNIQIITKSTSNLKVGETGPRLWSRNDSKSPNSKLLNLNQRGRSSSGLLDHRFVHCTCSPVALSEYHHRPLQAFTTTLMTYLPMDSFLSEEKLFDWEKSLKGRFGIKTTIQSFI